MTITRTETVFQACFPGFCFCVPERSLVCEVLRAGSRGGSCQPACRIPVFSPPVSTRTPPPPPQHTVCALGSRNPRTKSDTYTWQKHRVQQILRIEWTTATGMEVKWDKASSTTLNQLLTKQNGSDMAWTRDPPRVIMAPRAWL